MSPREVFEFGEFRLETRERRLSRGSVAIALAPKAYTLLEALVRRAGRLATKHELLALIWPDAFVEEGILAVHVSSLRKALGDDAHRYIETISRSGYRFIASIRVTNPEQPASATPVASLAVLPFKPLPGQTPDPSLELGVTDSLIVRFSGVDHLEVRPLNAVRHYSTLDQDVVEAGRELDVTRVLDGTIHCAEGRLKMTARLMAVRDGRCEWEASFDDVFPRIFDVEHTIVEQVVKLLDLPSTAERRGRDAKFRTTSSDAYRLYLRGKYLWERRTDENARKAMQCFEAAVDKDPDYALAWTGIAAYYAILPLTTGTQPREAFPKAREAALKALALDDSLSEAHTTLAGVRFWHEWDWPAAEREFRCAIDLNPNDPAAHRFFGHFLSNLGRHDEALREVRKALELEPLSIVTNARLAQFLYHAGDYDRALEQLRNTIELDPNFWMTHLILGQVLETCGRRSAALDALQKAHALARASGEASAALGYTLAVSGDVAAARAVLSELAERQSRGRSEAYHLALVCAGLGAETEMHKWLNRAVDDRDLGLTFMRVEPRWRAFTRDAVVQRVINKVGLPHPG